jgi:hypothetical protein
MTPLAVSSEVKWPGREGDDLPQCGVDDKMEMHSQFRHVLVA